jgi:hypothetical protein
VVPDSSVISGVIASAGAGTAIMVVLFLTGFLWTKHSVEEIMRERDAAMARAAEAERKLDAAMRTTIEQSVPLLQNFISASGTLIPILQGLVQERGRGDRD